MGAATRAKVKVYFVRSRSTTSAMPREIFHQTESSIFLVERQWLDGIMTEEEVDVLWEELTGLAWEKRKVLAPHQGYIDQPLRVYMMGDYPYTYSGGTSPNHPFTAMCEHLMKEINRIYGTDFNSGYMVMYRDGKDYVGFHADDERDLGSGTIAIDGAEYVGSMVATVSLGATRHFSICEMGSTKTLKKTPLNSGDLCLMAGACQKEFKHKIVPNKSTKDPPGVRFALTFRHFTSR